MPDAAMSEGIQLTEPPDPNLAFDTWISDQNDLLDVEALRQRFKAEQITTGAVLRALSDNDLRLLGIHTIGCRRLLLERISLLDDDMKPQKSLAVPQALHGKVDKMRVSHSNVLKSLGRHLDPVLADGKIDASDAEQVGSLLDGLKEFWELLGLIAALILTMTFPVCTEALEVAETEFPGIDATKTTFDMLMVLTTVGSVCVLLCTTVLYTYAVLLSATLQDKVWFISTFNVNLPNMLLMYMVLVPFVLSIPFGVLTTRGLEAGIAAASIALVAMLGFGCFFKDIFAKTSAYFSKTEGHPLAHTPS